MVGRPKIFRTPEEIKVLQKKQRQKNKKYFTNYHKYYYLKKILADPDYNKKNWARRKLNKSERENDK